jgi:hypothetical protein
MSKTVCVCVRGCVGGGSHGLARISHNACLVLSTCNHADCSGHSATAPVIYCVYKLKLTHHNRPHDCVTKTEPGVEY